MNILVELSIVDNVALIHVLFHLTVDVPHQRWDGSISHIGDNCHHHFLPHQATEIWQVQLAEHMIINYSDIEIIKLCILYFIIVPVLKLL